MSDDWIEDEALSFEGFTEVQIAQIKTGITDIPKAIDLYAEAKPIVIEADGLYAQAKALIVTADALYARAKPLIAEADAIITRDGPTLKMIVGVIQKRIS